jgi:uncharacterized protein YneF (UPF0154 family)
MTKNQYIKDNSYMAWLGKESLNNQIRHLMGSFGAGLTEKQINAVSEMIERHVKGAS